MSNHSFNELVVPLLQPDPARPGATVDRSDPWSGAINPRRENPDDTGFDADAHRVAPHEHPEQPIP